MCFFGKRREGKTFTMDWILYNLQWFFPRAYVFTNTKFNYFWQERVPNSQIYSGFHEGVLYRIIEEQKEVMETLKKAGLDLEERKEIARAVIIFDDCISADLHHSEVLKVLFYEGRHLGFCVMMSLQYAKGIPPGMRENCDMAFLFMMHAKAQTEAIGENFLGHFDKKVATRLLDEACWRDFDTGQRQCLVVNTAGNVPIDSMLFAAQPQKVPDYILGCAEFWGSDELPNHVKNRPLI